MSFIIKEVEYNIDDYDSSLLKLIFEGEMVSTEIINSLRKLLINQIPVYAFPSTKINILRNSSVFDNSYMKDRLSQLPIKKLNHKTIILPLKYYKDVNFNDNKFIKNIDDDEEIEIYIKEKNNGPDKIMNVSTNNIRLTINDEIMDPKKIYSEKSPILLIQLRVGEEFECAMKAVLAIGELDSIFNASNTYYEQINEKKFLLTIESSGQLTEYDLLDRACLIIIEKMKNIKENINKKDYQHIITESNILILEIYNEDHTCGGPINYFLQQMEEVIFAGITKPDFMQKIILIKLKVKENFKAIDMVNKSIDKCIELYNLLKKKFLELSNKKTIKKQ